MTISEQENVNLIHNFETLKREIAIERELQLISIAKVIGRDADLIIEKLRKLSKYEKEERENGKGAPGASKEADRIPLHVHQS